MVYVGVIFSIVCFAVAYRIEINCIYGVVKLNYPLYIWYRIRLKCVSLYGLVLQTLPFFICLFLCVFLCIFV